MVAAATVVQLSDKNVGKDDCDCCCCCKLLLCRFMDILFLLTVSDRIVGYVPYRYNTRMLAVYYTTVRLRCFLDRPTGQCMVRRIHRCSYVVRTDGMYVYSLLCLSN
jgi:hypothetical protein